MALAPLDPETRNLIDGRLVGSSSGASFDNVNPATEEVIGRCADGTREDMHAAIAAARRAFDETDWSTNAGFRKKCLLQLCDALQAAKERSVWGIGVDNDQSFLGPHILTSATKKVDVAVFDTIQAVVDGSFEGGGDTLYNVENGGVGFGEVSPDAPDREALIQKLEDVSQQIADGEIDIPRE